MRVARACGGDEDHRRQADRQHEHGEDCEDERDALLLAKKAAPGRADAAIVLSLREHVTRVVYGGRPDSPIGLVGATRTGGPESRVRLSPAGSGTLP